VTDIEDELLSVSADSANAVELKQPLFPFALRWAPDFDTLFRGGDEQETSIDVLVERALRDGRVLLQAPGGMGKTSVLRRLQKSIVSGESFVVLVDLSRWAPSLFDAFRLLEDNEPRRMQLLFDSLASPTGYTEEAIRMLPSTVTKLFLVDGLNEVPKDVGDALIRTLDSFARRNPHAGVIATDRLVRRPLEGPLWQLATIAPIEGDEGLNGNAFFRNLSLTDNSAAGSSTVANQRFLTQHADLSTEELDLLGRAAFALYAETQARSFPLAELQRMVGPQIVQKLLGAGVVVAEGHMASFGHHLYHDYLASKALAEDSDRWDDPGFETVTLRASSFDSLAMALEQLRDPTLADLLIRRIYDWNFYGAAYALSTCRIRQSTVVTERMEIALLAMLAERRWDLIRATSQQVEDALVLFPSPVADSLLRAESLDDILESVVEAMSGLSGETSDFAAWLRLFTVPVGEELTEDDLSSIGQDDSLMGWTVANVAKRARLSGRQLAWLRRLLSSSEEATVRWRVVHALGAHPTPEDVEILFEVLDDDYHWVRYGAVRSLVEIAARSSDLREGIFTRLRREVQNRRDDSWTIRQVGRSVLLREPPPGWAEVAGLLIEDLWAAAETRESQDSWRSIAYELKRAQDETARHGS
jgi:hypothetical protein